MGEKVRECRQLLGEILTVEGESEETRRHEMGVVKGRSCPKSHRWRHHTSGIPLVLRQEESAGMSSTEVLS